MSTWGFKGFFKRVLEFPGGLLEAVSPLGRMRMRYNESLDRAEISRNGGPYEPLNTDADAAYGGLSVKDNAVGQPFGAGFTVITQWDTVAPSQNVAADAATDTLTPAAAGAYMVTIVASLSLPAAAAPMFVQLAAFVDGVVTALQSASGIGGSANSQTIVLSGILELAAGDVVDARVFLDAEGETFVVTDGQFTIEKLSD